MELRVGQEVTLNSGERVKIESIDGSNPNIVFINTLGEGKNLSQISRNQIQGCEVEKDEQY